MKLKNNKIPTRFGKKMGYGICDDHYIDYGGKVFLIEESKDGTRYQFQRDGTACLQSSGKGIVRASFKTTSKYFNATYWYRLTRWFLDEGLLLFSDKWSTKTNLETFVNTFESLKKEFKPLAKPEKKVLEAIIKHASEKIGIELEFAFSESGEFAAMSKYGKNWCEAYVPVIYEGTRYFLTWENCD